MNEKKDNFKLWYTRILKSLYDDTNAGFVILMIAFPLLERYLREKSGVYQEDLSKKFYDELCKIFPALKTDRIAKDFWQVYRNGLLHQAALSEKTKWGRTMPKAWLTSEDIEQIKFDENKKTFWINPNGFAQKVVEVIEKDFQTFEGQGSPDHSMPRIEPMTGNDYPSGTQIISGKYGTSGGPW